MCLPLISTEKYNDKKRAVPNRNSSLYMPGVLHRLEIKSSYPILKQISKEDPELINFSQFAFID